ncbi:hypothetical protein DIPPA_61347 [Diplonema papillatum]|nr:hypothetical protein DIPPA_61347 [Diplonema papillatum]
MASPRLEMALWQLPRSLYLKRENVKVAICTWNSQHARASGIKGLEKWIHAKRGTEIIVVGMQEVRKSDDWIDKLTNELLQFDYLRVATVAKHELLICVFAIKRCAAAITNIADDSTRTGHVFSDKGSVSLRFALFSKKFLFINCHLDHSIETSKARNSGYHQILQLVNAGPPKDPNCSSLVNMVEAETDVLARSHLSVPGSPGSLKRSASPSSETSNSPTMDGVVKEPQLSLSDDDDHPSWAFPQAKDHAATTPSLGSSRATKHDYVFWLGNMNYRVDASVEDVMYWIAKKQYEEIVARDQMTAAMKEGSGFVGFHEAPITFAPTYKFFHDREDYDISKRLGTKRVPSYTDRVLWHTAVPVTSFLPAASSLVRPLKYKSYPRVRGSDHVPLSLVVSTAVYAPDEHQMECVKDLVLDGRLPQEIEQVLSAKQGIEDRDDYERNVFLAPIPEADDTVIGTGTVYSSDEDEESLALKQRRRMGKKISNIEVLLKRGPNSNSTKTDKVLRHNAKLDSLIGRLEKTQPQWQMSSIEVVGEMCANAMGRVDEAHDAVRHGEVLQVLVDRTTVLSRAFKSLSDGINMAAIALDKAMAEACRRGKTKNNITHRSIISSIEEDPSEACASVLDLGERTAFFSGYYLGLQVVAAEAQPEARNVDRRDEVDTPDFAHARKRLNELTAVEAELDRREQALDQKSGRVNDLHARVGCLQETVEALENELQASCALPTALQELEDRLRQEEVEVLQLRAALSKEQLIVASLSAGRERVAADFARKVGLMEDDIDRRHFWCSTMEEHLANKPRRKMKTSPTRKWTPGPGGGGGNIDLIISRTSLERHTERMVSKIGQAEMNTPGPPSPQSPQRSASLCVRNESSLSPQRGDCYRSGATPTLHKLTRECSRSPHREPLQPLQQEEGGRGRGSFLSLLRGF